MVSAYIRLRSALFIRDYELSPLFWREENSSLIWCRLQETATPFDDDLSLSLSFPLSLLFLFCFRSWQVAGLTRQFLEG